MELETYQRFCQSASPAELQETLEGIALRHTVMGVALPIIAIVDNCCSVREYLLRGIPDIEVVLDVYHFMMR